MRVLPDGRLALDSKLKDLEANPSYQAIINKYEKGDNISKKDLEVILNLVEVNEELGTILSRAVIFNKHQLTALVVINWLQDQGYKLEGMGPQAPKPEF